MTYVQVYEKYEDLLLNYERFKREDGFYELYDGSLVTIEELYKIVKIDGIEYFMPTY